MDARIKWGAPGTGKTHELKKILFGHGFNRALLTTFSRSTADDIKNDCARDMDVDPDKLKGVINTIHGTCYQLMGGTSYANVVDAKQIKEFNKESGCNFKVLNDMPGLDNGNGVYDAYTWMHNTETPLKHVDDYPNFRKLKMSQPEVVGEIEQYSEWKDHNNLIDFTDMLTHVLKSGLVPDVDLMLIDEFQDLTSIQNKIFKMWSNGIDNVVVAGDPLQSIYGFMGGSPDYFNELTGDIEIIPHSYRLSKQVWDYAVTVATDVDMDTPHIETAPHEGRIKDISYRDYVNDVTGWEGTSIYEVYHLVRSKYQAPAICKVMADHGIIWTGLGGWTNTQLNLLNTINRVRNDQPLFKPHLKALVNVYSTSLFDFWGTETELSDHIDNITNAELPGMPGGLVTMALYDILKSDSPVSSMMNLGKTTQQKLNKALQKHTTSIQFSEIKTSVLTIHAAKGLDANRVYLHSGISTNTKKAMRSDPAGEARVFYVGITRAKNELFIVKDKGANYHLPAVVV